MPRILHLAKYYPPHPGGIEYFLNDLVHAQARQGVPTAAIVHGDESRRRVDGPVEIFEAKTYGQLLYAPVSPAYPRRLSGALRQFRPDILHIHLPNTSAFWALTSRQARALPWLIHWHSDVVAERPGHVLEHAYRAYRHLEKRLLRRAQWVVASTADYQALSQPLKDWTGKTHIIPLGTDPRRFESEIRPPVVFSKGNNGKRLNVLVVARLAHYKGHEVLLHAMTRCEDVHAIIVGSGERERHLHRMTAELGLNRRVTLTGHLPQAQVNWLMKRCDVLCLPSIARSESFGLVLLEAMALGKPVIASNLAGSGMPWIVRQAGHGLLVEPKSPASLARALGQMKDRSLRAELESRARESFETQFHIDVIAEQLAAIYRQTNAPSHSEPR